MTEREHWLSLVPDGFATATEWFAHHQQFWASSLDRLASLVAELEAAGNDTSPADGGNA